MDILWVLEISRFSWFFYCVILFHVDTNFCDPMLSISRVFKQKSKKKTVFCIDVWFSKRYRTTLTCSNKLKICWGYIEWTLVRCSCVFFNGPEQFWNVTSQKLKFYILKMIFFSLEPHFSALTYSDFHIFSIK